MDTTARSQRLLGSPVLVWLVMVAIAALLTGLYVRSRAPTGYDITVAGAPYSLPDAKDGVPIVAAPIVNGTVDPTHAYEPPRDTQSTDGGSRTTSIRLVQPGEVAVQVTLPGGTKAYHNLRVEPVSSLLLATLLLLLVAVLLPFGLGVDQAGQLGGPWYQLLSEAGGGYSLARVQLLVWFLPTIILYGALSFTLHSFVEISAQLAVLMGLSGATTLLGTAASPPAAAGAAPVAPDLRDVVTDWNSHGDLSRYQYLLLSLVGATIMVAAFWRNLAMPDVPSQFLYLLAGSQGTYVATKAVKGAAFLNAAGSGGASTVAGAASAPPAPSTPNAPLSGAGASTPTSPVPAPATSSPAPAGTATTAGSFQLAGK
jgi:hypothetical protein